MTPGRQQPSKPKNTTQLSDKAVAKETNSLSTIVADEVETPSELVTKNQTKFGWKPKNDRKDGFEKFKNLLNGEISATKKYIFYSCFRLTFNAPSSFF